MRVLYFAWVRQRVGIGAETLDAPAEIRTVAALVTFLRSRGDGYAEAFADTKRLRAAVNLEHVPFETPIGPSDEIAFFPPVTGG
jgi:molybdopterin synthase sulfur carrier subunit